jgi:hypothetical protein
MNRRPAIVDRGGLGREAAGALFESGAILVDLAIKQFERGEVRELALGWDRRSVKDTTGGEILR